MSKDSVDVPELTGSPARGERAPWDDEGLLLWIERALHLDRRAAEAAVQMVRQKDKANLLDTIFCHGCGRDYGSEVFVVRKYGREFRFCVHCTDRVAQQEKS